MSTGLTGIFPVPRSVSGSTIWTCPIFYIPVKQPQGPWVCLRKLGAWEDSVYHSSQPGREELPRARPFRADTGTGTREEASDDQCGEIVCHREQPASLTPEKEQTGYSKTEAEKVHLHSMDPPLTTKAGVLLSEHSSQGPHRLKG